MSRPVAVSFDVALGPRVQDGWDTLSIPVPDPFSELFYQVSNYLSLSHLPKPSGTVGRVSRTAPATCGHTLLAWAHVSCPFGVISTVAGLNTREPHRARARSLMTWVPPVCESRLSPLRKSCGPQPARVV